MFPYYRRIKKLYHSKANDFKICVNNNSHIFLLSEKYFNKFYVTIQEPRMQAILEEFYQIYGNFQDKLRNIHEKISAFSVLF